MRTASVIVPSCRGGFRLERLLASLQPSRHQVLVIDNGVGLGGRFRGVEVVQLERNEGFARAVNVGARRAEEEAIVLVNDDCVCDPGFVEELAGALDPSVGVVMAAGVLRRWNEERRIESAGMEIDGTLLVWEYLHGEPLDVLAGEVEEPIGPSAAAAAFDRDAFLAAGGFDERLFAYWEDVDLVLRLRRQGGRCALAKRAQGVHEHAATLGSGSAAKNYLMGFGRGYVLHKWGGAASWRRLPAILARDGIICLGQAVVDRNVAGVRGRIEGYRAARSVPRFSYPGQLLAGHAAPGAFTTLRRRARRRAWSRQHARSGA